MFGETVDRGDMPYRRQAVLTRERKIYHAYLQWPMVWSGLGGYDERTGSGAVMMR